MKRSSGVLMPVFSIPSNYGIGTLGENVYKFIDFLKSSGQSYWQILPLNPIGGGNSPYQTCSFFAFNIFLIDVLELVKDNLLNEKEIKVLQCDIKNNHIDYDFLYNYKENILFLASERFMNKKDDGYLNFKNEFKYYLDNYALYKVLKKINNQKPFYEWDNKYRDYNYLKKVATINNVLIEKYCIIEYLFYKQWIKIKKYANDKGIKIIGDLPIYCGSDSCDCLFDKKNFLLDENFMPIKLAGCPPDNYNKDGQLWSNPVYDYDFIKANNYEYIIRKIKHLSKIYDCLRLDHFRGYSAYFSVDATEKSMKNGKWHHVPGDEIFAKIKNEKLNIEFIAEDLGFIDDNVRNLLYNTGFPGMNVLHFAFDNCNGKVDRYSKYLCENYDENSVSYFGTHDDDTINGWLLNGNKLDVSAYIEYLNIDVNDIKKVNDVNLKTIEKLMASKSNLIIFSMQDLLGYGSDTRINIPGTVSKNNWSYIFDENYILSNMSNYLYDITKKYNRLP